MFRRDFVNQRTSYPHPLWSELPKIVLTVDEVKVLVDEKNWEELTLSHGRLGLNIAGYYIYRGGNIDETVSAAMLGLCSAVNRMKRDDFENINPRGFIVSAIHRECFESVITDRIIPSGRNKPVCTCPLTYNMDSFDEFDIVEFDEVMELIAKSDFEREVIDLRRNGFEDHEIAEFFSTSRSSISRLRKTLHERFVSYVRSIKMGHTVQRNA